jgi:hypothetical protein
MTEFILRKLYASVRRRVAAVNGTYVLSYGAPLKCFVISLWCIFVPLGLFLVLGAPLQKQAQGHVVTALLFSGLMAMHLEFYYISILCDEHGIFTRSPWRPSRSISWSEIRNVTYSRMAQWYVIETESKGRVRCHVMLDGTQTLLDELSVRGFEVPTVQFLPGALE